MNFTNWQDSAGITQQTILQVKHTVKRDVWSGGGNGALWYSVTGLNATITPTSSSSKILIMVRLIAGTQYWEIQGRVTRNSTAIGLGTVRGSRQACGFAHLKYDSGYDYYDWFPMQYTYLDSPATTSALTYQVDLNPYSTNTIYVNRTHNDSDSWDYMGQPSSTITLMEIAT